MIITIYAIYELMFLDAKNITHQTCLKIIDYFSAVIYIFKKSVMVINWNIFLNRYTEFLSQGN